MSGRPTPSWEAPFGFEHVAVVDADWRADDAADARPCRWAMSNRKSCKAPSVARLNRGHRGRDSWWHYCPEHLYGRWVEDGQVMRWVVREREHDALVVGNEAKK